MIFQIHKARCGLEHQYRIEPAGHILAAIGRRGRVWEVLTVVTHPAGGLTLKGEGRTRTQAIRIRRRHLAAVEDRLRADRLSQEDL